jgi:hypothetical protein
LVTDSATAVATATAEAAGTAEATVAIYGYETHNNNDSIKGGCPRCGRAVRGAQ